MPQQPIDYTMRYQIRSGRVNFADYVQRRQLVQDGVLLGLNLYPPDNDASIVPIIQEGATNTTPAEYAEYLEQVAQEENPTATVPAAPTNLVVVNGDQQATISFTAGSDGGSPITNYEYIMLDASGAAWEAFDPPVTASPVTITGLPNGGPWRIQIRAVNAIGPGVASEIVEVSPAGPPSIPINLVATSGNGEITIDFTQTTDGGSPITNYLYSINNGTSFAEFDPAQTTTSVTITGLTNGTLYSIKLKAKTDTGVSAASATVSARPSDVPSAPTLTLALASDSSAYIYFTAGISYSLITEYQYTLDDGVSYNTISSDTASPVLIPGLTNGQLASIKLRAVNSTGTGSYSTAITVTPVNPSVPSALLYYDPSNSSSYSGSGTSVLNIGSYGAFTGTLTSVSYNASVAGGVFDFTGGYINFGTFNLGNSFTVSAWIYARSDYSINGLFTNTRSNQNPSGFKFGWNSWQSTDRRMLFEAGNGTDGSQQSSTEALIVFNTWQHITYIFNKINQTIIFCLNGVPVNMGAINTESNIGTNQSICIGAFTDNSYFMNAQLGYLKVFSGELNATEVLADYNTTKSRFGL